MLSRAVRRFSIVAQPFSNTSRSGSRALYASSRTIPLVGSSSTGYHHHSPSLLLSPIPSPVLHRPYSSTPMAAPSDTAALEQSSATDTIITPESLTTTLQSKLSTTHVDIQDMSGGCGQAFNAVIVSDQFNGKTALARHRLVNGALKTEIAAIHAWTPRCLTPEQWEKEKEKEHAA